jgi:hypothetical protein
MDDWTKMGVFWTLLVIALISWAIFTQIDARRQLDVSVAIPEQDAAEIVRDCFGVVWTSVSGPGEVNYRPKLRAGAPTVSVSFTPNGIQECEVALWTSYYHTRYGVMAHAQLMWRKRRQVARRLTARAQVGADERPSA